MTRRRRFILIEPQAPGGASARLFIRCIRERGVRAAFTLIELLVVISIISVLAAMFLPALSKAKARAVRVRCGGDQKQLSTAMIMFNDDYQRLPNGLVGQAFPSFVWTGAWADADLTSYYGNSADLRRWQIPVGAGMDNARLIATSANWCAPSRAACADGTWRVHRACHTSRTESKIKSTWITRYPLVTCNVQINWAGGTISNLKTEHPDGAYPAGVNIAYYDGHVAWRDRVGAIFQPHPSVTMPTDQGDHANSQGLWFFGYGAPKQLLPDEMNGHHPDQTNVIDKSTHMPSSTAAVHWMN